jgi:hypothetical protein
MLEIGSKLPQVVLLDAEDRALELASLYRDAPLAAIFLRHFG